MCRGQMIIACLLKSLQLLHFPCLSVLAYLLLLCSFCPPLACYQWQLLKLCIASSHISCWHWWQPAIQITCPSEGTWLKTTGSKRDKLHSHSVTMAGVKGKRGSYTYLSIKLLATSYFPLSLISPSLPVLRTLWAPFSSPCSYAGTLLSSVILLFQEKVKGTTTEVNIGRKKLHLFSRKVKIVRSSNLF